MSVTLSGTFLNPDGSNIGVGTLILTLSQSAVETGTGWVVPSVVRVPLTNGAIPSATTVLGNDVLTPSGTVYSASILTSAGFSWNLGSFSITGSSFNFNDAVPVSQNLIFPPTTLAIKPAAADAIQYVTAEGVDTNDGLSWGTAKLTLAAAVVALSSGGVVHIGAGTYDIGGTTIVPSAGTTITGTWESIITCSTLGASGSDHYLIELSNHDCSVVGIQIQGQATLSANNSQLGIVINANDCSVTNCLFSGADVSHGLNYCVVVASGTGAVIAQNRMENIMSGSTGVAAGVLTNGGSLGSIVGNLIVFTTSTATGAHQIYISQNSTQWIVAGNILQSGGSGMIKLYATDAQSPCEYNLVTNNILLDGGNGVSPVGAIDVENNAPNNKVSDNLIIGYVNGPGIELVQSGTTHAPDNCEISGNNIVSSGSYGILIAGASQTVVRGNTILSSGNHGIFIEGNVSNADNTQVLVNRVNSPGMFSINISSASPVATNTTIIGNSLFQALSDSGSGTIYGVNVVGTAATVAGNLSVAGTIQAAIYKGGLQESVVTASGSTDAVTFPASTFVTTPGVDAMTLATPAVTTDDGKTLTVTDTGGHAHTITTAASKIAPGHHLITFNGTVGSFVTLQAFQGLWYVQASSGVTVS